MRKKVLNNFVGGTSKLNNMLLLQQSPSCKLRLGGKNHKGKLMNRYVLLKFLIKHVLIVENKVILTFFVE